MRKWITLLMMSLVMGSCVSYANANTGQVTLEAGYRRDSINWRLRIPSDVPVFKSNTRFKDLDIFQIGVQGRATLGYNFYLRANAYWGWILDGDFRRNIHSYFGNDDYNNYGEGRFGQSFDSRSLIDDRYVYGVGAAIGYPFYFCDCTTIVAPVIGYAFDEQSVRFDDEGFGFGGDNDGYGQTNQRCCRQTFNSRWYGPFVGIDFNYRPYNECWNFFCDLEFHWGDFRGRRSGDNFAFFEEHNRSSHEATGWVVCAGADYDIYNQWTVGVSVKFQDWTANRHHRERFGFNGGDDYGYSDDESFSERARSNNKWHSYAINLTLGREF